MRFKRPVLTQKLLLNVMFALSLVFLASLGLHLVHVALFNGTTMSTYAADGTFQLYNPLRRLAGGQVLGYDFPFFHGIGIPLLHWPIFSLLGEGVFATEVAKWIVSPLAFLTSSFVFFYAFLRSFKKSTIALALLMPFTNVLMSEIFWPGNSLLGLRGTFPILVAAAVFWRTNKTFRVWKLTIPLNDLAALLLLGLSVLFGTEQGVAAIIAYALTQLIRLFKSYRHKALFHQIALLALKGLVIVSISLILFTIITHGHPLSALRYAFVDIPSDQGWYFGAEPQSSLNWGNMFTLLVEPLMLPIWSSLLLGSIASLFIFRLASLREYRWPSLFAIGYGVVAFGITIAGYYQPSVQLIALQRIAILLFISVGVCLLFDPRTVDLIRSPRRKNYQLLKRVSVLALYTYLILILAGTAYSLVSSTVRSFHTISLLKTARDAMHQNDYFAASPGWKSSIDAFQPYIEPGETVWSTYTSIYETVLTDQEQGPSQGGEDYIIHALGHQRREAYESQFIESTPEYVITLKPSYFVFEEWLWTSHWRLYQHLFTQYDLIAENDSHYLWRVDDHALAPALESKPAPIVNNSLQLPANESREPIVYSLSLSYKASSAIPGTERLSRYLIDVRGIDAGQQYAISLPPYMESWTIPVIVMPGDQGVTIGARVAGILPATLTLRHADYSSTQIGAAELKPFINNFCFMNQSANKDLPICKR